MYHVVATKARRSMMGPISKGWGPSFLEIEAKPRLAVSSYWVLLPFVHYLSILGRETNMRPLD